MFRFIANLLGWDDERTALARGSSSTKLHIFASIGVTFVILKTVAADADESHSRLLRQNTGGSDALYLGAPPVTKQP